MRNVPGAPVPGRCGSRGLASPGSRYRIPVYSTETAPLALLFPGQGSQAVGMGQSLLDGSAAARATFDEAEAVLGFALRRLCLEGPAADLADTHNTQPALLTVSVAVLRETAARMGGSLPLPTAFAGHSMGEYSALVAAGALTFADGLRLVRERGRLMREAGLRNPGRMAAVLGMDADNLAALCREVANDCGEIVQIANDNSPSQQVVSGTAAAVAQVERLAPDRGARRVVPLDVSIAAHCPLMASAAEGMARVVADVGIRKPVAPVVLNTTAAPSRDPADIRRELVDQMTGGVLWRASVQRIAELGVAAMAEMGSGNVLAGLNRRIVRRTPTVSLQTMEDIESWCAARED